MTEGDFVYHKLTGNKMMVLSVWDGMRGTEIQCRLEDGSTQWFKWFELTEANTK